MKQKVSQNLGYLTAKFIIVDVIGDILYWPIWWYSRGLKKLVLYIYHEIVYFESRIGLKMWLSNLFKPMYGQRDWQGRLISFFMRFVVLIYKTIRFILWIFLLFIIFFAWILIIPFCVYQLIFNFWYFIVP
ncbi:MAG: hypothetical protein US74_C0014G0002 [Parcubacteria group bacterium GW2011_GWA2_38_13]|nr:MAG: hypothetical protein US74_C0014G0002 [Parcubacteria group bacterium GW2011_GWA2_38_13]